MTSSAGAPVRAVFIGPMSSGKSKLGKRVARALRSPFHDTDKMISALHGDIPSIFQQFGEEQFRQWEREAVESALHLGGVVSLGGGAILNQSTCEDLAKLPVIYLHITREAVSSHLSTKNRPLLAEGIDAWERIFAERRPIYESLATIDFDTSSANAEQLTNAVTEWIISREAGAHD